MKLSLQNASIAKRMNGSRPFLTWIDRTNLRYYRLKMHLRNRTETKGKQNYFDWKVINQLNAHSQWVSFGSLRTVDNLIIWVIDENWVVCYTASSAAIIERKCGGIMDITHKNWWYSVVFAIFLSVSIRSDFNWILE